MEKNNRKFVLTIILMVIFLITTCFAAVTIYNKYNKTVKIGVIDSLLDDKYLSKYDVVTNKKIVKDTAINNHGIAILSIIKQNSNAKIYYASTLDSTLKSSIDNIVKAIYWCVENDVDIINMSFATTEDNASMKKAINYAISKDVIIVASCINFKDVKAYPAMYNGVVSVSNTDSSKASIIVKEQEYSIKLLDGKIIKGSGTSCSTAAVTNQIAKELSGEINLDIVKKVKK